MKNKEERIESYKEFVENHALEWWLIITRSKEKERIINNIFSGLNEDEATEIISDVLLSVSDEVASEYSGFFEQIYALYQTKEFAKLLKERLKDIKNEDIIEVVESITRHEELDE